MEHYGPNISEYKLPVTDVCREKRNFPGYDETEFYTLDDMKQNNNKFREQSGTTDTDAETDTTDNYKGYAAIYKKKGKVTDWSGQKLGTAAKSIPNARINNG